MPRKSTNNQGKFFPKAPTSSNIQPSFFIGDYEFPSLTTWEMENTLRKPPKFFEEPIVEKWPTSPTQTMHQN